MSGQLLCAIRQVKSEIEHRPDSFQKQSQTIRFLIDPILIALDWNNPMRVEYEYPIRRNSVDIALKQKDRAVALIEVKPLKAPLGENELEQIIRYSVHKGAKTAILTNGTDWRVYRPMLTELDDFDQRLLFHLCLDKDDVAESERKLKGLRYEEINHLDKEDTRILLDAYWDSRAKDELLDSFSRTMRDSIVKWSERGSGEIPAGKVKSWLRKKIFPGSQHPVSRHRGQHTSSSRQGTRLTVVLDGEHFHAENYRYVLVHTAEWLVRRGRLDRPFRTENAKNDLVNHYGEHKELRRKHLKELSNGLHIYTNFAPEASVKTARKLLDDLGYSQDVLQIIEHND